MFLRGADVSKPAKSTGGIDSTPSHTHFFSDTASVYISRRDLNGWSGYQVPSRASEFYSNIYSLTVDSNIGQQDQDTHGHSGDAYVSGSTGSGGSSDNRPRFYSVTYIIRIK